MGPYFVGTIYSTAAVNGLTIIQNMHGYDIYVHINSE